MAFLDWCVLSGKQMQELELKIHEVLFPNIEFEYREYCRKRGLDYSSSNIDRHWRNAKCDVLTLWCHIWYGGDILVTSDGYRILGKAIPKSVEDVEELASA